MRIEDVGRSEAKNKDGYGENAKRTNEESKLKKAGLLAYSRSFAHG